MAPLSHHEVNFAEPRDFLTVLKANVKEALFPDDPFAQFKDGPLSRRIIKGIRYFVPASEWLPKYTLSLFKYDLLAGITIASLAIPQGISYAKLAHLPPIIGLYSSFVPPLIYAVFGNSKHIAVGTVAACSLLIADSIERVAPSDKNLELYVSLVFTSAFFSGVVMTALGVFRMGILVDFLSHSTITGFMGGTALLICLQQLKGMLGMKTFTQKTDVVSVLRYVVKNRDEWRWESAVAGLSFLAFLEITRFLKRKKPKLFWVSAIAPMITVIVGCLFAYFGHWDKHGIPTVGKLRKGLNPLSINRLIFDSKYIMAPLKAGLITAMMALAEGIAIGRSFAILQNQHVDGSKEMIAFGLMNIVGSFTSCYLTTGPFSKTAVNYNSGCRTAMSNVIMSVCMLLTLLLLAPLFSYTPLVALSAIITSAMIGLMKYKKFHHLFQTDKFDFCIAIIAFIGVSFISMDVGLMMSVGLALIRALLYIARPAPCKLANIPNSHLYRDAEQYPESVVTPGILAIQLGSPIYFANSSYIRDRIMRYLRDEQSAVGGNVIEYVLLDLGGVSAIDITGVETFIEIRRNLQSKKVKMILVNPRISVMEKLIVTKFIELIGKESVYLSIEEAIDACRFTLTISKENDVAEVDTS